MAPDPEIDRLERELAGLDRKVDALSETCVRADERVAALVVTVDEMKRGLEARRQMERDERREDRRLLIGAAVTITVAVIGAIASLLAAGGGIG